MKPTLNEVKNLIDQLSAKIKAPKELLPTYGYPIDNGQSNIEIDNNGQLCYLTYEGGTERYFLRDMDDLLYYVFNNVTLEMAGRIELSNRIQGQDTRRIWFVEQEQLLGILNEKWKLRKQKEHEQILKDYTFNDPSVRK